jgi:hypothetical protein
LVHGTPSGRLGRGSRRVEFDCRLRLESHGSRITSDAGLFAYRELNDALGLTDLAGRVLSEYRRGKNTPPLLPGLLRQSVFGRLAGYEDVQSPLPLPHIALTPRKKLQLRFLAGPPFWKKRGEEDNVQT